MDRRPINPDGTVTTEESTCLEDEVTRAINRVSAENGSDTPDFILGKYLSRCLDAFNEASRAREKWYGVESRIGASRTIELPNKDPSEKAIGIAARVWCDQDMGSVVMDGDAAMTIAGIIDAVIESSDNLLMYR